MKKIGMSILAATALASTMAMAGGDIEPAKAEVSAKKGEVVKRKLKGNMVVEYNVLPEARRVSQVCSRTVSSMAV
ncbi:hypothetical protein [Sulfurovum mangrovi]|uniref:hypothetical protein n=1 Tax=Sulfurovum mangrovi TaxID=2893889 RepID=UPI001E53EBC2|nr:hypothetical protein [Sulfurovum mangrovi]UFH60797.1 hypothetical protein LN246_14695 [Sulfurovum mangrovi]